MSLFREYLLILAGGALGSAFGSAFGALVGVVSPEFIAALTQPHPIQAPERAGAAMGLIGGLLVGGAAMAAGRLVGAVRVWAGCDRGPAGPTAAPDHGDR